MANVVYPVPCHYTSWSTPCACNTWSGFKNYQLNMMTSWNGNIFRVLALCEGKPPVTGWFPPQRSVTRSFDVCFDLRLNKRLSKQSTARCFDTPSCSLWRHCYEFSLISKWICFFKKSHAIGSHIQVVWPTGLCACMGHGSSDHYVLWLNCTVPRNRGRFTCQSSGSNTLSIIKFTGIAD